MEIETTLSQEWSRNRIQRPQCAFELSMFMCPAVHKLTRNLLRSSSTHEPSDPPFRVVFYNYKSPSPKECVNDHNGTFSHVTFVIASEEIKYEYSKRTGASTNMQSATSNY